jgi:hypothetical protein
MAKDRMYAGFMRVAAADIWGAEKVRALTKWWFDLVQNFVLAAVLLYLARKSGSLPLALIAYISFAALMLYCLTYTTWWFFDPLRMYEGKRLVRMATYQIANVVSLLTFWFAWLAVTKAIDAISMAQG